jgi:hypothetical protein
VCHYTSNRNNSGNTTLTTKWCTLKDTEEFLPSDKLANKARIPSEVSMLHYSIVENLKINSGNFRDILRKLRRSE